MKEITPKLTHQKKLEVNKFIKYIYQNTGIKFKCRSMKDYVFLKILYLLLISYEDIDEEFYKPVFNHYGEYNEMKKANYFGYNLKDILKQYIVKYYYGDLTNFAVIWNYYEDLVLDDFEDRLDQGFITLEKKLNKNNEKLNHLLDNITMCAMDYAVIEKLKKDIKEGKNSYVIWHTQRDNVVCTECAEHNGNKYYHLLDIPERHPNCRCWLENIEV